MKKLFNNFVTLLTIILLFSACNAKKEKNMTEFKKGTFGYDLNFLSKNDSLVVLKSNDGKAQVIVSPKYQAKVFTSTAQGLEGTSIGFIGYKAFDVAKPNEHMNGYGGENRFWLGPEGGKYSIYFQEGAKQIFENWHTPKPIDIESWTLLHANDKQVVMKKEMEVSNYLGNTLKLHIDRKIQLIETDEVWKNFEIKKDINIDLVAYATENTITNLNNFAWTEKTGTICIWILDMFVPGPKALTFIPFNEGSEIELGKVATTDYFGEIPADRLKIENNILYMKTDGRFRSKVGMNGKRTKSIAGNYNPDLQCLTITTYDVSKTAIYLNQEWNPLKNPLIGDAVNAYNDGPLDDGSIMGPFLELESVSPAAFLEPSKSLIHKHNVFHFIGEEKYLTAITEKLFGISINEIKRIF